jgi:MFS family permease
LTGLGALLPYYIPEYAKGELTHRLNFSPYSADCGCQEGASYADITALMTYPTMFMGIGNLVTMPLALAIGRRPMFLASLIILIMATLLCAFAED